jgi:hypothetical protein
MDLIKMPGIHPMVVTRSLATQTNTRELTGEGPSEVELKQTVQDLQNALKIEKDKNEKLNLSVLTKDSQLSKVLSIDTTYLTVR